MFKCMPFLSCNRHVEAIDKRHQNLTSFPDEIVRYYRTLEELLLDSNQLHELPKGFYKLTQLRKLDISDNEIERISAEIGNFVNLIEFDCNRNDIQELPDTIRYMRSLQVLDISNNPIQSLPVTLTQLRALTELTLNDLSLAALPDDIGALANLRSLQGRDNLLKHIPESLCSIARLESLDLGSNEIEEIPAGVGKLANLKVLWLDLNQLKHLPAEIGKLKRLQYLELSENMLETLPDEIGGCTALTDINLAQNSIEYLPASVGQLAALSILKLEQNQLVVLTPAIGQCAALTELVLTENLLCELPASVGALGRLTNLNLDRNRLARLPDELCRCESITLLFVRDNQLCSLPDELGALRNLRVLDVAGNRLAHLPYSLGENTALSAIWLAENQATGKIKLQADFDEREHKEVLTCYLLPQHNYVEPPPHQQQQQQQQVQQQQETDDQGEPTIASLAAAVPAATALATTNESVRFAPELDTDEHMSHFVRTNTPHPKELVKKKEALKQRHAAAAAAAAATQQQQPQPQTTSVTTEPLPSQLPQIAATTTSNDNDNDEHTNAGETSAPTNVVVVGGGGGCGKHVDFRVATTASSSSNGPAAAEVKRVTLSDEVVTLDDQRDQGEDDEEEEEEEDNNVNENNNENDENKSRATSNEQSATAAGEGGEGGQFRLRRRDTPHHLKGARLNSTSANIQQLDQSEMKQILQRYSNPPAPLQNGTGSTKAQQQQQQQQQPPVARLVCVAESQQANEAAADAATPRPACDYIPSSLRSHDPVRSYVQLHIKIAKNSGSGGGGGDSNIGIRIAGGKGSTSPFSKSGNDSDSDGIFITRVAATSPARHTGLKVGDKLVKVNQTQLADLTHQQAVDVLKEAVVSASSSELLTLLVLQTVDWRKLFFLEIAAADLQQQHQHQQHGAGFRINHNFNTHQQLEVEVIFVGDQRRFGELRKGDILLQINGKNVDAISEKELNKFILNSANSSPANDHLIRHLTVYRPYVAGVEQYDEQQQIAASSSSSSSTTTTTTATATATTHEVEQQQQLNKLYETPYAIEEIRIEKQNGAMGLSIVGGGQVACHPFGADKPGIFISKILAAGAASRTPLRVGDRLLRVNGVDVTRMSHDETVEELKRNKTHVTLLVSHDPEPSGLMEIVLRRSHPDETIGIRINGGIENKSANIFDASDEGIFVVNIIDGTLAARDARLHVGTRLTEVNGQSLLGVKLSEAQSYLIRSSELVHMVVCDGFNHLIDADTAAKLNDHNGPQPSTLARLNARTTTPTSTASTTTTAAATTPFPQPPPPPPTVPKPTLRQTLGQTQASLSNGLVVDVLNGASATTTTTTASSGCISDHVDFKTIANQLVPVAFKSASVATTSSSAACDNYDNLNNIDDDIGDVDDDDHEHMHGDDDGVDYDDEGVISDEITDNRHVVAPTTTPAAAPATATATPLSRLGNGKPPMATATINDKSIMNNIMNRSNAAAHATATSTATTTATATATALKDAKSQSMFVTAPANIANGKNNLENGVSLAVRTHFRNFHSFNL